ncbi:ligase-associated DNA damage response exonuclease [Marinivivus vitaminiproducens]|uniref:ligase-associated DNA damage response exonuclease n=1 Tax=Marinivivus vitaminiproducens TaxID=3035935 RepID=UPI0027A4F18F|nr:ligase-associated DNA damage response exonuclease [Geminicoccaceae bacterium SCSIO 64248]
MADDLLRLDDRGLFCRKGGFHIDPWRPVERAVITHAHSDHARFGSRHYHCADQGVGLMRRRLGEDASIQGHAYREPIDLAGVRVSFHPAGHVLGSAQIRVEADGQVWVVSGDYKIEPDPSCAAFEAVPCDVFVTEATFALPIYRWEPGERLMDDIFAWWDANTRAGRASVLLGYSLGKAQRVLAAVAERTDRPVYVHGAIEPLVEAYRAEGITLAPTVPVAETGRGHSFAAELVLAPPSAFASPWMRRFGDARTAFLSGWMRVRGNRRRRGYDHGFVMSDHADWPGLLATVNATGARRVYATHGYSDVLARYLREETGVDASSLQTLYGTAEDED